MTKLRKSPLKDSSYTNSSRPLRNGVIDHHILKQTFKLSNNQNVVLDFEKLINKVQSEDQKASIINIAISTRESLQDRSSKDSEYTMYQSFVAYLNYCVTRELNPFSRKGYLSYCGRKGELMRLIELANKPRAFVYMFQNNDEIGIRATTAQTKLVGITRMLIRAKKFHESWNRDVPKLTTDKNPSKPFTQSEKNKLLRRVQFLFFSLCSELLVKDSQVTDSESVTAVLDKLANDELLSIDLYNSRPKTGEINMSSPFNVAMTMGYYLFCYYSNLNTTSIINVMHPIEFSAFRKENRTTRYTSIRAWKGRSNKQVEAVFSESKQKEKNNDNDLYFEMDKTDGLTFINALVKLSKRNNPNFHDIQHPPLFYFLSYRGETKPFKPNRTTSVDEIIGVYSEKKSLHTPYLIERFFEVVDKHAITKVSVSKGKVIKKTVKMRSNETKRMAPLLAFAAMRSMTDIPLKNIYMPLRYSDIDANGNVRISFNYSDGREGSFVTDSKYITFLQRLEEYSSYYNPPIRSKYNPNQKVTPFLLSLGQQYQTYQWEGEELAIKFCLRQVGIFTDDFILGITAQKFRSTGASDNYEENNGGLTVSTSLLQNNIKTLHDHYLEGDINQNQIIASQAIEVLEEFARTDSLVKAKQLVKKRRKIEVLEYESWKKKRLATNPNGLLCEGQPSGDAQKEHRSSSARTKKIVKDKIHLACFQYDKCVDCNSAKLVNDVQSAYKLLSFVELLEESALALPEREQELNARAESLLDLAQYNLSDSIIALAEEKLSNEGRYPLHSEDFLTSMDGVNFDA